ncbi:ankyrin repeat-containing domain protein [Xylaria cf. heliscus]|nr:ankyrin repeat-containing domain protein [Xylaria cf. heliscus]
MAMSRKSSKLSDQQWENHKDLIRKAYLEDNGSLKEVQSKLKEQGLIVTANQIETKMRSWNFRKNVDKETWVSIDHHITKRKRDGKESEVILSGKRMKQQTVKRETDRYGDRSMLTKVALGNSSPPPLTDCQVAVCTPQPIQMEFEWPATLPWFMFSSRELPKIFEACKPFMLESQNASSSDLVSTLLPEALGTDMAHIGVSKLAAIIGRSMPERYPQENLERAQNLLGGSAADFARAYVSMIIYNVSNNASYLEDHSKCEETIKVLEDYGIFRIDVNLGEYKSPTINGFMEKLFKASIHGCLRTKYRYSGDTPAETAVKWLVTSGYCPNTAAEDLWIAVREFRVCIPGTQQRVLDLTKYLLKAGASADILLPRSVESFTILEIALELGWDNDKVFNLAELLFEHGAAKNLNRALYFAIKRKDKGLVEMIVKHGCDLTANLESLPGRPWYKTTALTVAAFTGLQQTSHILDVLSFQYPHTPLATFIIPDVFIAAALGGHDDVIHSLYEISPNIMANEFGITPLLTAARYGHLSTCQVLLSLKGVHNTWLTEKFPPLHAACHHREKGVVELLITNGADVNAAPRFDSDEELRFKNRLDMYFYRSGMTPLELLFRETSLLSSSARYSSSDVLSCAALLIRAGAKLVGSELGKAAEHCHLELLAACIAAGANPNRLDRDGKTLLQLALQGPANRSDRLYGVVLHLLSKGAQLLDGEVVSAIRLKQYDAARLLMEHRGNMMGMPLINELEAAILVRDSVSVDTIFEIMPSIYSAGALYAAIVTGDNSLIKTLMQNRPTETSDDPFEITAIAVAAVSGNLVLLQKLLAHPPSCRTGPLPLEKRNDLTNVNRGWTSVRYFLSDLHQPGSLRSTNYGARLYGSPLALLATSGHSNALNVCSYLLESGFCADGPTWAVAAFCSNTAFIQTLLNHGQRIDYSYQDFYDSDPLLCAIYYSGKALIPLLLTAGADVNGRGRCVGLPLLAAVKGGDLDIVKYLVQAGANINADGRHYDSPSPLRQALESGKVDIADYFIRAGAEVNANDSTLQGYSLLRLAVENGNLGIVDSLIRAGAEVDADNETLGGDSPLQMAVKNGRTDIVHRLLEADADVNSPPAGEEGATALQFAAINGHLGLARHLIDKGAQVNALPAKFYGRTSLQGAAEHGRLDMLEFLLTEGAETEGRWRRRFIKAVKLAIQERHFTAANFLKRSKGWSEEDENTLQDVDVDYDTDSQEEEEEEEEDCMDSSDEGCDGGLNVGHEMDLDGYDFNVEYEMDLNEYDG